MDLAKDVCGYFIGIIGEGAYQHCVFVRLSYRFGCLSVFSIMGIGFMVFRTCLFVFVHTIITMSLVATPGHVRRTMYHRCWYASGDQCLKTRSVIGLRQTLGDGVRSLINDQLNRRFILLELGNAGSFSSISEETDCFL